VAALQRRLIALRQDQCALFRQTELENDIGTFPVKADGNLRIVSDAEVAA
jgi:hypothetical protein